MITSIFSASNLAGDVFKKISLGMTMTAFACGLVIVGEVSAENETNRLSANKLSANKLAANKLSANKLAANKLAANKLAANKLAANKLAANKLAANKLAANSISQSEVSAELPERNSGSSNGLQLENVTVESGRLYRAE